MTFPTSLPAEVLTEIFNSCDTLQQAIALGSACRRFHSLWLSISSLIIRRLGRAEIRAFDDALIAVRATAIAQKHLANGNLPPDLFPFHQLSPETNLASHDELLGVFGYEHLVKCFENIVWHDLFKGTVGLEDFDENPERWETWRVGFHASMYRLFLVGAALCRAYQEPFFPYDDDRPRDFLQTLKTAISEEQYFVKSAFDLNDIQYLLNYPAYNFGDHEGHQQIFGSLVEFLVRLSRARAHGHQLKEVPSLFESMGFTSPPGLDNEASTLFAELVQLLFAYYQLDRLYLKLVTYQKRNGECIRSRTRLREKVRWQPKKMTVIIPGVFYPDEFSMPRRIEDAGKLLSVRPADLSTKTAALSTDFPYENLDILLQCLHRASGQPNKYDDFFSTHEPHYEFIQFLCQRHLGLRFSEEAFDPMKEESHYSLWEGECNVFDQTTQDIQAAAEMFTSADTEYEPYFEEMECMI
ncbi:hypothetical protein SI65_06890 [Aspergillus cristatus]|uniref:F-box domain-containing protein n=1 Tax=Aspergillus cristatus TaxID=573508 RepID=A0A1E3BAV6_ASPCR|nr:hypothetical protein SI65_06890 [Aspergillus cristatus]